MKTKTIHFIGIGSAGRLLVEDIKANIGEKAEYSFVNKTDYGSIFPDILNYVPKSKRTNYYNKEILPETFLAKYANKEHKYILVTGSGGVFSSYFIEKLNDGLNSLNMDYINLLLEPIKFEGTAVERASVVKSKIDKNNNTLTINLDLIRATNKDCTTLNLLFEKAYQQLLEIANKIVENCE